ncbi:MAG: GNAT family N-acetyltransferase [Clostridia bacterium]|nr:GNAT family N-acetyltransferase [Clostridia bacterium]
MTIRTANIDDTEALAAVEAECFPPAEAATADEIRARVEAFPDHFWLLFDGDKLVSFVDGFCTDEEDLTDEMYADAKLHNENGAWQMIFGVNTIPAYRRQGCAGKLLNAAIEDARKSGRKGLVLTCKDKLVHYYASFGFEKEGLSDSTHGGAVWYQMRLKF